MKSENTQIKKESHLVSTVFLIIFLAAAVFSFIFMPILFSLIIFILFLFPVMVYIILGKITKRWGVSFLIINVVYLLILILLALFIYKDTISLMDNIKTQPVHLIYKDSSAIIFAYSLNLTESNDISKLINSVIEIPKDKIPDLIETQNKKDKFLLIIDKSFFNSLKDPVKIEIESYNFEFNKSDLFEALKSDAPEEILLPKILGENYNDIKNYLVISPNLEENPLQNIVNLNINNINMQQFPQINKGSIRLAIIGYLSYELFAENGPEYVFNSIKSKSINIMPNYAVVWVAKNLPFEFLNKYFNNFISQMQNIN